MKPSQTCRSTCLQSRRFEPRSPGRLRVRIDQPLLTNDIEFLGCTGFLEIIYDPFKFIPFCALFAQMAP
jgi:hypothetical protein